MILNLLKLLTEKNGGLLIQFMSAKISLRYRIRRASNFRTKGGKLGKINFSVASLFCFAYDVVLSLATGRCDVRHTLETPDENSDPVQARLSVVALHDRRPSLHLRASEAIGSQVQRCPHAPHQDLASGGVHWKARDRFDPRQGLGEAAHRQRDPP